MKKAITFIACFAILIFTLSAFADHQVAPAVGYKAPEINITNAGDSSTMSLNDFRGENIIVTFWSATDADSRIRCNEYAALVSHTDDLQHIAVNFDSNEQLYREIVRLDNMADDMQYHVSGQQARDIIEAYHLDRGLHSFLINRGGIVLAIDPDVARFSI